MDLSVIICTYNRSASLQRTLESLSSSCVPDGMAWQVIVVDNNSADDTAAVVERCRQTGAFPLRYVREERQGISFARNRGIDEADGEILAFTDDDVVVDRHWIGSLVEGFRRYDAQCIGGRILPVWEAPKPEWLTEYLHVNLALLDYGEVPFFVEKPNLWGANLAVKAEAFVRHGVFDTCRGRVPDRLYGDEESHFLRRLLEKKEKVLYLPQAVVHHCIPKERMNRMYFRRWSYDQGELQGALYEEGSGATKAAIPGILLRGLSVSLLSFLKSFLPRHDSLYYQRGAAYRLGVTKGRVKTLLR